MVKRLAEAAAERRLASGKKNTQKHLSAFLAAIPAFLSAARNVCPHSLAGRCFDSSRGGRGGWGAFTSC